MTLASSPTARPCTAPASSLRPLALSRARPRFIRRASATGAFWQWPTKAWAIPPRRHGAGGSTGRNGGGVGFSGGLAAGGGVLMARYDRARHPGGDRRGGASCLEGDLTGGGASVVFSLPGVLVLGKLVLLYNANRG